MSENTTTQMYFGGLPTEPDVQRLCTAVDPTPGTEITYDQLAALLEIDKHSRRFRTILRAWRHHLFDESNVDTKAIPGHAIRFLLAPERTEESVTTALIGMRKLGRAYRRNQATPVQELTLPQRQKHDHVHSLLGHILHVATATRKQLALPPAVTPQPVLGPPE